MNTYDKLTPEEKRVSKIRGIYGVRNILMFGTGALSTGGTYIMASSLMSGDIDKAVVGGAVTLLAIPTYVVAVNRNKELRKELFQENNNEYYNKINNRISDGNFVSGVLGALTVISLNIACISEEPNIQVKAIMSGLISALDIGINHAIIKKYKNDFNEIIDVRVKK